MNVSLSVERIRYWGLKAGIAILDQGLFSGSNFVLNILLARWLRPEEYGAFSIAFAIYLFFSGFHNALVLEPMSVFGTAKYSDVLKGYLTGQFFIHFVVAGLSGLVILIIGLTFYYFHLVEEFLSLFVIGAGIFLPFMLLIWLARRSCYVIGKPGWALGSSFVYSVVLFLGAFFIHSHESLASPLSWYFLLGVASLAGSLLVYMNPAMIAFETANWLVWLREQWSFGKWIGLAAFLNFAGTQVQLFIVAAQLGLGQAGAFRALQNFMLPMMQILAAISMLALPSIAFEFGKGNLLNVNSKSLKTALGLIFASLSYLVVLFVFAKPAESFLYDGKFAEFTSLIFVIAFVPLIASIEVGYSLVVRSLQRPVYYAVSTGAMALTGIVFTPIFVSLWGVQGAVLTLILVALVSLVVNVWFYRKWFISELVMEHKGQ
jgi:O-antigen/teichoic acid export membrane protein